MPDESTVHCQEQQGVVTLTCGGEAFARLKEAIAAAGGPTVVVPAAAEVVVLRRASAPRPPPNRWLDAVGYLGCGAVAVAVIVLLGAGAYTVSNWLW